MVLFLLPRSAHVAVSMVFVFLFSGRKYFCHKCGHDKKTNSKSLANMNLNIYLGSSDSTLDQSTA